MPGMNFSYAPSGAPDMNLRTEARPAIGFQGGNVRPPMPTMNTLPLAQGGEQPQRNMPQPNAQAFANANPNARFLRDATVQASSDRPNQDPNSAAYRDAMGQMKRDENGNQFMDNPQGQRPAPSALMQAMIPKIDREREFRRRQFLAGMIAQNPQLQQALARNPNGIPGPFAPQSGGFYAGGQQPQYQMGTLPMQAPPQYSMGTLPLPADAGTMPIAYGEPNGGYQMSTLPLQQFQPINSVYDLTSPF